MNTRYRSFVVVTSLLVVLAALTSVVVRVALAESEGRRAAYADFDELAIGLSSVRQPSDLAAPALRQRLARHYAASPDLLLVFIVEKDRGLLWRLPARSPYLFAIENDARDPAASIPQRSSILLAAPLEAAGRDRLSLQAVYTVIPQDAVYLAFRDSAILLGLWLFLALLLGLLFGHSKVDATWRVGAARPAPAGGEGLDPGLDNRPAPPRESMSPATIGSSARIRAESSAEPAFDDEVGLGRDEEADFEAEAGKLAPRFSEDWTAGMEGEGAADREPPPLDGSAEGEPQGLFSPLSGLGWESYLEDRLEAELSRAASFEQDLSFLVLSLEGLAPGSPPYRRLAKALNDFFSFKDLAFEKGQDGFAVILPNLDAEHALRMAEEFHKKVIFLLAEDEGRTAASPRRDALPLFMGLSSRAGRLVEAARILGEAELALGHAREEDDAKIVAFKPDPDKYRLYLASKGI